MKRAVIVAHPDDEVLWAAGAIMRAPGTTVICCTIPRSDPIRAVKFIDACAVLGATPFVFNRQEPPANESITWLDEIPLDDFDHIITHNAWGEYGHLQHKDVHRYVCRRYGKKALTFFGVKPKAPGGLGGVHRVELTEFEVARKMKALKCYDHHHPYNGGSPPKWEALYHRYIKTEGISFDIESYDGASPGLSNL